MSFLAAAIISASHAAAACYLIGPYDGSPWWAVPFIIGSLAVQVRSVKS